MSEIRILSFDPGVINIGWSVVSWRDPGLLSVLMYGVFRFERDLDILENLNNLFVGIPFSKSGELFTEVVIEDQPYINNKDDALRNFKLHQVQMGIQGICVACKLPVTRVTPRKARTDLGICSGDYVLNKKLSIEFCKQKLGAEFSAIVPALRNHVADTVMLAYWVLSKARGLKILENDQPQDSVWIPPERWTNHAPLHRRSSPPSPSEEGGGGSTTETCNYVTVKQVRKQRGPRKQAQGSS